MRSLDGGLRPLASGRQSKSKRISKHVSDAEPYFSKVRVMGFRYCGLIWETVGESEPQPNRFIV